MIGTWIRVLASPRSAFAAEKQNASYLEALKNWFVSALLSVAFLAASSVVERARWDYLGRSLYENFGLSGVITDFSGSFFQYFIILVALFLLYCLASLLLHLVAKLFDGSGSFRELFYLQSLSLASVQLVAGAFVLASTVVDPNRTVGFFLLLLLSLLYLLFLSVRAVGVAHGFDQTTSFKLIGASATVLLLAFVAILFTAPVISNVFSPPQPDPGYLIAERMHTQLKMVSSSGYGYSEPWRIFVKKGTEIDMRAVLKIDLPEISPQTTRFCFSDGLAKYFFGPGSTSNYSCNSDCESGVTSFGPVAQDAVFYSVACGDSSGGRGGAFRIALAENANKASETCIIPTTCAS